MCFTVLWGQTNIHPCCDKNNRQITDETKTESFSSPVRGDALGGGGEVWECLLRPTLIFPMANSLHTLLPISRQKLFLWYIRSRIQHI